MSRSVWLLLLGLCSCLPELERDPVDVRIREALPNWTTACDRCLQEQCAVPVRRCAEDPACTEFVSCRWAEGSNPNPASALACGQQHATSDEQPGSAVRELSSCWQNDCATACALGTRWECAGAYSVPAPVSSNAVTVRQVIQRLNSEDPVSGATVRFCDSLVHPNDCDTNFQGEGVTDSEGVAAIDLPVLKDDRAGWSGYGRVTLPDGGLLRLQSNLVVSRSRFALQHVPSALETVALRGLFGGRPELGNVVFQVFDCAHTNADGVLLELSPDTAGGQIQDESTVVGYLRAQGFAARLDPDGTRTQDGGGGAILNLIPDEWLWVTARLAATGDELARTRIRTAPGELLLLQLHPEPRPD